jgi:hypothetical protein
MDERPTSTAETSPDVRCPSCDYLLRGLPGAIVTCPECGESCDVPKLIARRRTDWMTSPVYRRLFAAGMLCPFALISALLTVILIPHVDAGAIASGTIAIVLGAGWFALVHRAAKGRFDREFLVLALLSHLFQTALMLCALIVVVGGAAILGSTLALLLPEGRETAALIVVISTIAAFGAIVFLCKSDRFDRAVGVRCIRWELRVD